MRSDAVVVMGIRFQNPTQMRLAQDNHMVDALAPDRSDQPFGKAILPGRGWAGRLVPDAHGAQSARDNAAIDAVPVADHVARSFIPRECFCDLARNPFRGRMCCDADPDQLSAIQPHYDVGVEQVEANGRDNEQVHGSNILNMITQKGAPSLAWRPASLDHVFGDTRLRDLKPELEQLTRECAAHPKAGSPCLLAGSARAAPSRFMAALPVYTISTASSSESRSDPNARASRAG